jgi:hypothetical protein
VRKRGRNFTQALVVGLSVLKPAAHFASEIEMEKHFIKYDGELYLADEVDKLHLTVPVFEERLGRRFSKPTTPPS